MRRFRCVLALLLALALLSGCAGRTPAEDGTLHILATTYPVYLFTTAVTDGVEGVEVTLLVNSQTSCLHDYTLTVKDMKSIDRADVIVMNGAGLEDFMADALARSDAKVIDCSENITLLPTLEHVGHDGHDHEEEYDPHYWMDPRRAAAAIYTIADGLSAVDSDHEDTYQTNADVTYIHHMGGMAQDADVAQIMAANVTGGCLSLDNVCVSTDFIPFHNGFQYFADAFGLNLVKSIEEEEGATASAAEIKELVALMEEQHIPAIFVEKNGSRKTADVIARETGCKVYELDLLMSGSGEGIQPYLDAIEGDLITISEAFS